MAVTSLASAAMAGNVVAAASADEGAKVSVSCTRASSGGVLDPPQAANNTAAPTAESRNRIEIMGSLLLI